MCLLNFPVHRRRNVTVHGTENTNARLTAQVSRVT